MDKALHPSSALFAHLRLPSERQGIDQFTEAQAPLADAVKLSTASFWTAAQAALRRQALMLDSDRAKLVDPLNDALRQSPGT